MQKFPEDIKNEAGISSILIIDTKGLHNLDMINNEFDR
jgi:hypothetical protein